MKRRKLNWILIASLAFMALIYGWDAFSGDASPKTWVMFIVFIALAVGTVLMQFGVIKTQEKDPRETYLLITGMCVGWGMCLFFNLMAKDFTFDSQAVASLLMLVLLIILTIVLKKSGDKS